MKRKGVLCWAIDTEREAEAVERREGEGLEGGEGPREAEEEEQVVE